MLRTLRPLPRQRFLRFHAVLPAPADLAVRALLVLSMIVLPLILTLEFCILILLRSRITLMHWRANAVGEDQRALVPVAVMSMCAHPAPFEDHPWRYS